MKRVFVLGAGFSKAICSKMPTLPELSKGVLDDKALTIDDNPARRDASSYGDDVERWLSALADPGPWLSEANQLRSRARFDDLSAAIARAIGGAEANAFRTECPDWLATLVKYWHESQSTVITFNYDRLVELAYLGLQCNQAPRAKDLYAIPLTPLAAREGGGYPDARQRTFRLLKLHGSLAWWYSGLGGDPHDPVYLTEWRGGYREGIVSDDDADVLAVDKKELIIPPAATKSPYYGNRLVAAQWRQAAVAIQKLEDEDELILMGYSVPATDLTVANLISTNLRAKPAIVPIGRDSEVVTRLSRILSSKEKTHKVDGRFSTKDKATPIKDWWDETGARAT